MDKIKMIDKNMLLTKLSDLQRGVYYENEAIPQNYF